MFSPRQARKTEEKLGLIFGRIRAIRIRLNSLAWQRGAFGALGWLIGIGAIIVLAAFYLQPLMFLVVGAMLGVLAIAFTAKHDALAVLGVTDLLAALEAGGASGRIDLQLRALGGCAARGKKLGDVVE